MKKDWQYRYEHERDVQKAHCESLGIEPPKETYGTLKHMKVLQQVFNGKTFWPIFNKLGHSTATFETCKCKMNMRPYLN